MVAKPAKRISSYQLPAFILVTWCVVITSTVQMESNQKMKCMYPCVCNLEPLTCPQGSHIVLDECGCCRGCLAENAANKKGNLQKGDACNSDEMCDNKLHCLDGTCNDLHGGGGCFVNNTWYNSEEEWQPDCRTRCTCQHGNYGCVTLCPHENQKPSSNNCENPRLVSVEGACCKEWVCGTTIQEKMPTNIEKKNGTCAVYVRDWTPCSTTCGIGLSVRVSNQNTDCRMTSYVRLCKVRPCEANHGIRSFYKEDSATSFRQRHKAWFTLGPEHVTYGNCTSLKTHHLHYCRDCDSRKCCVPSQTVTKTLHFQCVEPNNKNRLEMTKFMWIRKCRCERVDKY